MSDQTKKDAEMGQGKLPELPAAIDAAALPPEVQGPIGNRLRQVYGRLLSEPLPDRFNDLLAKLAKSEPEE